MRHGGYPGRLTPPLQRSKGYEYDIGQEGRPAALGAHCKAGALEQTAPAAGSSEAQHGAGRPGKTDARRESLIEPVRRRPDSVVGIDLAYSESAAGGKDARRLTDK